jgi:hypothetical protein
MWIFHEGFRKEYSKRPNTNKISLWEEREE